MPLVNEIPTIEVLHLGSENVEEHPIFETQLKEEKVAVHIEETQPEVLHLEPSSSVLPGSEPKLTEMSPEQAIANRNHLENEEYEATGEKALKELAQTIHAAASRQEP